MVKDDSYEIIPHQLLADLKAEVSILKEKLMGPDKATQVLVESMREMQKSLHELQIVFNEVLSETKTEEEHDPHKEIMETLKKITDQNEQIARGMVAVADMVEKSVQHRVPMGVPRRPPAARVIPNQPAPPPYPSAPRRMKPPQGAALGVGAPAPPPPGMPSGPGFAQVQGGMPPPPPPKPKKESLLGKLFKKK